ncbi:MAG: beta-ketoacyl-ACP synthase II [Clostridiales bacterium]|jgi:3-oxoacyl-[acyl-carrier-protein] synthase II|nr:beta-ketoacyl-ACP synthase II [Clostridiales bacterium]
MNRVVVTGLGAVTPIGNDVETFWKSLVDGKCGVDFITRFDTADFKVKIAAEVKGFDPLQYIPKNEVRKMDLFCQYALAAAEQAVRDSGIIGNVDPEKLGVYVGSGIGGMETFVGQTEKLITNGPKRISPHFIPMMIGNMAAGDIAIKYNAQGPSLPVVTACATSTNTIGEAYRAIKHGYAQAVIAGGAEATINELAVAGFTNCMALSTCNEPERASIPFDKRRDGFVMGEGSAIVVLEEYEHAKQRGAHIYAELVGYGNTCDAYHVTAPQPEGKGAAAAMRLALEEAGALNSEKLYINAHGTSTGLNDKGETLAIKKVLGDRAYDVLISSTKSMTGHMLGAAGAVEAVVSALAVKHGVVPPTIGYQEKDPDCDLNYVPNQAVEADLEYAMSNSFGFGGHNACLVFRKV